MEYNIGYKDTILPWVVFSAQKNKIFPKETAVSCLQPAEEWH